MRRPRRRLEVSTFPFLAVLLCAMGSLILLLLVLDRRAKAAARARAAESARAAWTASSALARATALARRSRTSSSRMSEPIAHSSTARNGNVETSRRRGGRLMRPPPAA